MLCQYGRLVIAYCLAEHYFITKLTVPTTMIRLYSLRLRVCVVYLPFNNLIQDHLIINVLPEDM